MRLNIEEVNVWTEISVLLSRLQLERIFGMP